ncbi:MAG: hypothetical protein KDG55_19165, partial [Rhodocyclaceae bacterium]|nr:hypothetical protein [Rhodocyclaceae bacterium]
LMGLLRDDDTRTATKVPLLGDIPGIGRLFTSQFNDAKKTEVVLLITPHVVRNLNRPDAGIASIWSGTDAVLRVAQPLARGPLVADAATHAGATISDAPVAAGASAMPAERVAVAGPARSDGVSGMKFAIGLGGRGVAAPASVAPALAMAADAGPEAAGAPASTRPAPGLPPVRYSWKGPEAIRVGETFDLVVRADSSQPLNSTSLQLRFDPAQLELVSVDEGSLLKGGGGRTVFRQRAYPAGGRIAVGVAREGEEGVAGAGDLLSLKLKARMPVAAAEVHLMSVAPIGPGKAVLPVQASGPFKVQVAP